jgi:hypothetical protein
MARPRTARSDSSKHLQKILKEIEARRKEAEKEGLNFTAPTEEELIEKLQRVNSPMIVFQGWSGSSPQSGQINYSVGVFNPDPVSRSSLYVHVLVGPGNFVSDVGDALETLDERFPRLTLPSFFGLTVNSGATQRLDFTIPIPNVEASNYLGNSFLFQAAYHDVGTYFDRSVFPFEVT